MTTTAKSVDLKVTDTLRDKQMAVFNEEEDRHTVKLLAMTMAGFAGLTVFLIVFAALMT